MTGLYDPVVIDSTAPNFSNVSLTIQCTPGEGLDRSQARKLCRNVSTLFENQGAIVNTVAPSGGLSSTNPFADAAEAQATKDSKDVVGKTNLSMELKGRELHKSQHPVSWLFWAASFTLAPAIVESTFAQDVTIRDETGFLLAQKTLVGRMVRYSGVGTYLGNLLLDYTLRDKDDRLIGNRGRAGHEDLSEDLYGQLTQVLFNADMQRRVLLESSVTPQPVATKTPAVESLPGIPLEVTAPPVDNVVEIQGGPAPTAAPDIP